MKKLILTLLLITILSLSMSIVSSCNIGGIAGNLPSSSGSGSGNTQHSGTTYESDGKFDEKDSNIGKDSEKFTDSEKVTDSESVHMHNFTQQNHDNEYLASTSTCTDSAKYYYSCSCGKKGFETFDYGNPSGHTEVIDEAVAPTETKTGLTEGKHCSVCGKVLVAQTEIPALASKGLSYYVNDDGTTCTIKGIGSCTDTEVIIPSKTENGYTVTKIGASAFKDCQNLTSVTIPDSVISIDNSAFAGCSGLASITIPNSVTSIFRDSFSNCENLKYYEYDNALYLGNGNNPYVALVGAKSIDITSCIINERCITIADSAFEGCSGLTTITIPDNVTSICGSAFYKCSRLKSITIGKNVTSISYHAFSSCGSLASITIPNSVTSIYDYAFSHCDKLTNITIGNSVTSIGEEAFWKCSALSSMNFQGNIESWCKINFGSKYSNPTYFTHKLLINGEEIKNIIVPDSITGINGYTFIGCNGLTSVTIPDSVTYIGSSAFNGCSGLTSVTIPSSVTSINGSAFNGCSGLRNITIPDSVTYIGSSAFNGCSNLKYNEYDNALYLGNENNLYIALIKAKSTDITNCVVNNKCKIIPDYAFEDCVKLANISIPDDITFVGKNAFRSCDKLKYTEYNNALYLGNENNPYVTLIKAESTNIVSCVVSNKCKRISHSAFSGCDWLQSITIPDSVTYIGYSAFSGCKRLTSITIPDSVTYIDSSAFYGCGVISITIPDSVTSIDYGAFAWCRELTKIIIPNSVNSIGDYAFGGCSRLETVYYTGTSEEWDCISIGSDNYKLTSAKRYYYSESEPNLNIDGTAYDGNYWHYDENGKAVIWDFKA